MATGVETSAGCFSIAPFARQLKERLNERHFWPALSKPKGVTHASETFGPQPLGLKLRRFRRHRKSREAQSIFKRTNGRLALMCRCGRVVGSSSPNPAQDHRNSPRVQSRPSLQQPSRHALLSPSQHRRLQQHLCRKKFGERRRWRNRMELTWCAACSPE